MMSGTYQSQKTGHPVHLCGRSPGVYKIIIIMPVHKHTKKASVPRQAWADVHKSIRLVGEMTPTEVSCLNEETGRVDYNRYDPGSTAKRSDFFCSKCGERCNG